MSEQHPEEWGERRRRREEERARRLAAEQAAAQQASVPQTSVGQAPAADHGSVATQRPSAAAPAAAAPVPSTRPRSRRELREQSAAAAAREQGPSAAPPSGPTAAPAAAATPKPTTTPVASPTPAATPEPTTTPTPAAGPGQTARPEAPRAEAPGRPRSRRELRAATSETGVVPEVVPPAMTGGIRRVTADGSLGKVEPASSEVLSAEARASALRAQALRAQAEREEAARRGVERGQAQRAAIQRADAERAAQVRAHRFAEQVAAQTRSPTALPIAEVEDSGHGAATPLVSTWSEAPTAARSAVPSAFEAEREARERAEEIARARDAAVAQQRAAQVELERQARENILRAERERGAARPGAGPGAAVRGAAPAEQPLPAPRWGAVSEVASASTPIVDPHEGPGAQGTEPAATADRPAAGAQTSSAVESAPVPIPRWSSVAGSGQAGPAAPEGPADEPSDPVPSLTGSTPAPAPRWVPSVGSRAGRDASPAWPVPIDGSAPQDAAGTTGRQAEGSDEPDDEQDEPPARVYTWMHIIALAVVAFVLGMLIVMVLLQDNSQSVPATSEAVRATLVEPGSLGALHLLSTGI